MTVHKICSEKIKSFSTHTKKHHYLPESPDRGFFSTSPENLHSILCTYLKTDRCQQQKSVFSYEELQRSRAVIASSAKREDVCDVQLKWGALEGLSKSWSWQVPQASSLCCFCPSWSPGALLGQPDTAVGTELLCYVGSPMAVFMKAGLLFPMARQS